MTDRLRVTLIPASVRTAFSDLVDPVADWLIRWRVQPNTITVVSAVVLLGSGVSAEEHARVAGTITYELLTGIDSSPERARRTVTDA